MPKVHVHYRVECLVGRQQNVEFHYRDYGWLLLIHITYCTMLHTFLDSMAGTHYIYPVTHAFSVNRYMYNYKIKISINLYALHVYSQLT